MFSCWLVFGQYYYFDSWTTTYPYQQWCSEELFVRLSTQLHPQWAMAWRFHLVLDPITISYTNSLDVPTLRTNLFVPSQTTFTNWSASSSPSWQPWSSTTILQIDRSNNLVPYKGNGWLYWRILFVPKYFLVPTQTSFGMEYNGLTTWSSSTIETTISAWWWVETIQPASQNQYLTSTYLVLQQPCAADTQIPNINLSNPLNWANKQSHTAWITFSLTDVWWQSSQVPYVWTGGNLWTWNIWWIDTQYWIDISSLTIYLSWNNQNRLFTWSTYALPYWAKTWQFLDRNYTVQIPSSVLFDYWIEKEIQFTVSVKDHNWNIQTNTISFNRPQSPTLIPNSRYPVENSLFVQYNVPIRFWVQDDWAGIDSWSIVVTLSWTDWTKYWPYSFSWNSLLFSGIAGNALQPNWIVELSDHSDFPLSWTILVHVSVRDMEWNQSNISDYKFSVRPACSFFWCWYEKNLYFKNTFHWLTKPTLFISWWINPSFYVDNGTWYINCGVENQWLRIYRWDQNASSWNEAQLITVLEKNTLYIMGNHIKLVLSWSTLIIKKLFDYWSLWQWWGWGGWGSKMDYCPDWDDSFSYYDGICHGNMHGSAKTCPVPSSPYDQELTDAFQFAYGVWITTMCPIENAALTSPLLRKHLAKMIVEYSVVNVGLYPDITKEWCDAYDDMDDQTPEMQSYSKLVCQLWLMWLESNWIQPKKSFDPEEIVTRAQFWTILSRLIFGDEYNIHTWENYERYEKHLNALKSYQVINNIETPGMSEMRGWVMLMLHRTYRNGMVNKYRMLHNAENSIRVLYGSE